MKLTHLQQDLRRRVIDLASTLYNVELETIAGEIPPRTELGDLAFPVAFELAKRIKQATGEKRNPRQIAEEIADHLRAVETVARVDIAGAGYINVFFNRAQLLAKTFQGVDKETTQTTSGKIIVEHTNINPNKAAHIGHLRNAVLGDAFVRLLRAAHHTVEVQNYIDNTGVQVADVVVGFMHLEGMTLEDVKRLDATLPAGKPFDYFCWDLYARTGLYYRGGTSDGAEDKTRLALRAETLHLIEAGDNETARLADYVATRIVERHLKTMARLEIAYNVLPRESEILHLRFWDAAFARLKETGAVRLETEGKHAGCWVMPLDAHDSTDEHEADKILVRSNGTVTYAGKDIAYQLWKLGQLDKDFYYKPFHENTDGSIIYVSTSDANEDEARAPKFGAGNMIYNVIDSRQSYTQDVVKRGVAAVAPNVGAEASVHLSYEMVALSPAACEELGIALSDEDRRRPHIEMSGRKGLGVKADDLINRLELSALEETAKRNPDLSDAQKQVVAHIVAVGALRYFLLKWTRTSVIAFDFKEALSFEGETGPYCQYGATRANSLFRKIDEATLVNAQNLLARAAEDEATLNRLGAVLADESGTELWSLWSLAARFDEAIKMSVAQVEPAFAAKYAFQLAKAFSVFYQRKTNRILEEQDDARRAVLIAVAHLARANLTRALDVLGIQVPERM